MHGWTSQPWHPQAQVGQTIGFFSYLRSALFFWLADHTPWHGFLLNCWRRFGGSILRQNRHHVGNIDQSYRLALAINNRQLADLAGGHDSDGVDHHRAGRYPQRLPRHYLAYGSIQIAVAAVLEQPGKIAVGENA